ncbi:MAG: DUF4062 domain-containing protein [Gammaproteobacteria bacterium]|jgi:hypothetical protein
MSKKTIFISSTYDDLKEYRGKTWQLLEEYDVNIRGMEQFGARTTSPLKTCYAEIDQSDIYVGIIGFRLGSTDEKTGKSITQLEYERACEYNKDILIYLIDENALVCQSYVSKYDDRLQLDEFKKTLKSSHTIVFFQDEKDFIEKLSCDLNKRLHKKLSPISITDSALIKKFILQPKTYAGRIIQIKIKIKGRPFPISKSICENIYSLEFGSTIGVNIEILEPKNITNYFEYLIISPNECENFLSFVKSKKELTIEATMYFLEERFNREAHFQDHTYMNSCVGGVWNEASQNFSQPFERFISAEASLILVFKSII